MSQSKILMFCFFVVIVLQGLTVFLLYQNRTNPVSQNQLFVDGNGRVVDPYQQREVKNTISKQAEKIQDCYNAYVARVANVEGVTTDGTLHIDWWLSAQGNVEEASVVYSNFADAALKECVVLEIKKTSFPPPGQARYAEHRFQFSKQQ